MGSGGFLFGSFFNKKQDQDKQRSDFHYATSLEDHLKRKEEIRKKQEQYDKEKLAAKKMSK